MWKFLASIICLTCSTAATAAPPSWSEIDICRAVAASYFSLSTVPRYLREEGSAHALSADDNRVYLCSINDDAATLFWRENGTFAQSRALQFVARGSDLIVSTDYGTEGYVLDRTGKILNLQD